LRRDCSSGGAEPGLGFDGAVRAQGQEIACRPCLLSSIPNSRNQPFEIFLFLALELALRNACHEGVLLAGLLAIGPRVYSRWETGDVTPHFDTIVRLAGILDALAGRKDVKSESTIKNPKLSRLRRNVDLLSDDQRALVIVLDSPVKRSRVMAGL
jgi:hypothetical protein